MKPITFQRHNIIFLSSHGLCIRKIASQTGLEKSTAAQVLQELEPERPRLHEDCPSMLSDTNKQTIVLQIITDKAKNAVQAIKFINSIVNPPVFSQTVRNTLKKASLKAVVKKKKPLL